MLEIERFPETKWTWIRQATEGDRREALAKLCHAYWYPVYCFLRRKGAPPDEAGDITQDFFAYLMAQNVLEQVEPRENARFRSWLRSAAKHYFLNHLAKKAAKVHGGGAHHSTIDAALAERKLARELMHTLTPDKLFDRCWARTVTERARAALHVRYPDPADIALMAEIVVELSGESERRTDPDSRGPKSGQERTQKCRRRKELLAAYKRCLRREINGTVGTAALVDREIADLLTELD
jgi:DNA-directed RNA polymerase specialized sigma24 family protein